KFEKLKEKFTGEFSELEVSLRKLSSLYRNIPITDSMKKNWSEGLMKRKSAWYACLVNTNIDVLLLPEYLESRQSRNILLKKETDQYYRSFENFDLLKNKSNSELFECILFNEDSNSNNGFDLFSAQVTETAKCPQKISEMFENWQEFDPNTNKLEQLVFEFFEWLELNEGSFSGQRQMVLWLNYQFKKLYGAVTGRFNLEEYLFNRSKQEGLVLETELKGFLEYLCEEVNMNLDALKQNYKQNIGFENLKPNQKLVANHLFYIGFDHHFPIPIQISQYPGFKSLLKKGFISISDFGSKPEFEKYEPIMNTLLEKGFIVPVEEGEMYYCLSTKSANSNSRLMPYINVSYSSNALEWEKFISQYEMKDNKVVEMAIEKIPVMEIPEFKPKKKKVFFG
ncbi:MAG TPA: hypothetical protein VGF79_04350, partial [Bacteroidia bacterium]